MLFIRCFACESLRHEQALLLFARCEQVNGIVRRLSVALVCAGDAEDVLQQQLMFPGDTGFAGAEGAGDETRESDRLDTALLHDVASRIDALPHSLPGLCREQHERLCIMLPVSARAYGEHGASLDDAGKHFCIVASTRMAAEAEDVERLRLTACDVCWAWCSRTQAELLSAVMPPQPCWHHVRAIGVVLWLRDRSALMQLCRRVVNVEYRRKTESGDKDPECVALLHVALGQVRVLSQLYALAGQRKVSTFGPCRFQDQECVRTHARADWSLFPPN